MLALIDEPACVACVHLALRGGRLGGVGRGLLGRLAADVSALNEELSQHTQALRKVQALESTLNKYNADLSSGRAEHAKLQEELERLRRRELQHDGEVLLELRAPPLEEGAVEVGVGERLEQVGQLLRVGEARRLLEEAADAPPVVPGSINVVVPDASSGDTRSGDTAGGDARSLR